VLVGVTVVLIEDAPYYTCVSYLIPLTTDGILVADCILELARIWQPHCQDKTHTQRDIYKAK
jgi:hypothetical protein